MLATEVRSGDAPKHTFSMKTDGKSKKSGKNTQTVFFEQKQDMIGSTKYTGTNIKGVNNRDKVK